ncbi:hypothetical protein B0H13DRAFT_2313207 [Mycena leptocephala]|nr:hypothetical protein B0H13DRAFT_2313207 [Mycena leptocephala]
MASVSPAAELELLQLIADARTTNYLAAAGMTVLLFEHISTFPEEVRFVWKNRLSLWSVLYVWIRYYTLVVVSLTIGIVSIVPVKEYLHIGQATMRSVSKSTLTPTQTDFNGVLPGDGSSICGRQLLAVRFAARMPVITLFLRDGVFLFFTIMLYTLVEIVIWTKGRQSLVEVPIIPATALHAIVGARILLNIKNLGTDQNDTVTSMELSNLSWHMDRPYAARMKLPWYLQTGEPSNSEELREEIY